MSLLNPQSIAVIGASADEQKVGHMVLKNILTQGFRGDVYPVNPHGGTLLGKEVYQSVETIPGSVDLAVIVTPADTVSALLEACGKKRIPTVIVISAGFGETGTEEGRAKEEEMHAIAKKYDIALVGPNCLGIMRPHLGLNASFGSRLPPAGSVAFLSQSGALGDAFIDRAESLGLGLSLFVSMGNKAAMDECDYLEMCREDPQTTVIGLYLENIKDGRRFRDLAADIGAAKPIVLLKAGTTERGRRAVSSHTGALAGSDAAVDAICRGAGIRRATTADDFLDLLRTLATQPIMPGTAIAIVTNAGGPGVLATDAAEREKLTLPPLSADGEKKLHAALPPAASTKNPIDVLGDAHADRYEAAVQAAAKDPEMDGLVCLLTPQAMTPVSDIARMLVNVKRLHPLFPIVACFMGEQDVHEAITILQKGGIPNVSCPEQAIHLLSALREPARDKTVQTRPDAKRAKAAQGILSGNTGLLDEEHAAKICALYHLPLPPEAVATTAEQAWEQAKTMGFPVTLKISSGDILHKTDMGGVRVNLRTEADVRAAYEDILRNAKKRAPTARIRGILVQRSLPPGNEFIVGALRDPSAGPLVMVGLGGIYTELFRDTVFRCAPVSEDDALRMLASLKSWPLLLGMRGKPPLAITALADIIARTSSLIAECPQIAEIDLNPVLVAEKDAQILDVKIVQA